VQTLNGVDHILFTGHKQIDTKATNETTKAQGPKHFPKWTFLKKECRWEQYHPHKVSVILHTTTTQGQT